MIKLEIDSSFCIICTVLSTMLECSQNATDFKVYGFLADIDMMDHLFKMEKKNYSV